MGMGLQYYEVHNMLGDLLATYPYTVDGLYRAAEHANGRTPGTTVISNPNNVDYDNPQGLLPSEKDYLEVVWGIV